MSMRPLSRPRPLYATCDSGAEEALATELTKLKCERVEPAHRGVYFWGADVDLWRVNLYSRLANRVLVPLTEFVAETREQLYRECKKVRWDWWVHTSQTIAVDASSHASEMTHTHFIAQVVKDAVVDQLRERFDERPSVSTEDPDLPINARLAGNICTLSLDASGPRLHRRSYRLDGGPAPIKETLGSLLNHLARWRPTEPVIDLTCGSGTLLIEAALRAQLRPVGWERAERGGFAFQRWRSHSAHRFQEWLSAASRPTPLKAHFWGSDIDPRQIARARRNSERAGTPEVEWSVGALEETAERASQWLDALEAAGLETRSERRAVILMNMPYGERLRGADSQGKWRGRGGKRGKRDGRETHEKHTLHESHEPHDLDEARDAAREAEDQRAREEARALFRALGDQLRAHFRECEAWILVGERSPWREIRLKPREVIELRNGPIPVKLVCIPLYQARRGAE